MAPSGGRFEKRGWRAATALAVGAVWLVALSPAASRGQSGSFTPRDETPEMYPAAPHREDTFYFCSACHGFRIVSTQGMSRERWDESLTWMTERHNMPKLEGQERSNVLDYLAQAFPERASPRGWKNPFGD